MRNSRLISELTLYIHFHQFPSVEKINLAEMMMMDLPFIFGPPPPPLILFLCRKFHCIFSLHFFKALKALMGCIQNICGVLSCAMSRIMLLVKDGDTTCHCEWWVCDWMLLSFTRRSSRHSLYYSRRVRNATVPHTKRHSSTQCNASSVAYLYC